VARLTGRPGHERGDDGFGLSWGQRVALARAVLLALGLAGYGAVGSYETITQLAAEAGVPLPRLVPLGLDGGLMGVLALDLVLAWTGQPVGWLRQVARLLTVGTVAANVSAGWPDQVAAGLHAAAPTMLLVMVEAGRAVLLRRAGLASGGGRDRIPVARWILAPWRTWLLWRRMVLWQFTSYRAALDIEMHLAGLSSACASDTDVDGRVRRPQIWSGSYERGFSQRRHLLASKSCLNL
jgi:hypothetical protein